MRATSARTLPPRALLAALAFAGTGGLVALLLSSAIGQARGGSPPAELDNQSCLGCHGAGVSKGVNTASLAASPHKNKKCVECHYYITAVPHTPEMLKQKAECGTCHGDEAEKFRSSVHAKPGPFAGDHPSCVQCHGDGDPHAVKQLNRWMRSQIVAVCSRCHSQQQRMQRHGPPGVGISVDAVTSYNESFHGKALLRFGNTKVAICTDCHHQHDVLSPSDPRAPTNDGNVAATCGQPGCHPGARMNFAMSGANHLRLKMRESVVLRLELLFFRLLIFGVIGGMLTVIVLDLRTKVLAHGEGPASGRPVALLIALAFLSIIVTIGLATLNVPGAFWTWMAANALLALAFLVYWVEKPHLRKHGPEKQFLRLPVILRLHHFLLFASFSTLALTGLPLRFALWPGVPRIHALFGGLAGARLTHRTAAIVLILTWIWHIGYLLLRWHRAGYTLKSWTMLPNRKDLADVIAAGKFYLGISKEEPQFGRFQFREKMDYLAEYWGMPVMILTGFVLWFPIYFGNRLPAIGLSFAYIAHSYEATLAFLAIVTWHLYNAHLNPATFPMNPVWLTGRMSRSEMEREHPLELADLEAAEQAEPPAEPDAPTA